ncbi:cysteine desulfurase/selenocysteine lyase [Rhodococcus sp. 27YEA15]|uniref:aminotransferase class V-fold PLP-dependent enzyme n=1 Tax=Rhodococcus sp. 27YEA15 TaxID=3156259 RepID=UPI003C7B4407
MSDSPRSDSEFIARHFPLKPTGAYLDTGAIGLVPVGVGEALARCAQALGVGTLGSSSWEASGASAHTLIAAEYGVAESRLQSLATTGEAMNAAARAIVWEHGDEVLVFSDDFPTVRLPWRGLGHGTRVVELAPPSDENRTSALIEALSPRTRVVSVAHVHPVTGSTVDLSALGHACRDNGTFLIVDGAQSAGVLRLDLSEVDVYIGTAYKWLLAGFGFTTLVTSERFTEAAVPGLLGYANTPPSQSLVYAHRNLFGMYSIRAAAEVRLEFGLDRVARRTLEHVSRLHTELSALGFQPMAPLALSAGIVTVDGLDAAPLVAALGERGISVANRQGNVRISPYFYTSDAEIDQCLVSFAELAPLYRR